MSKLKGFYHQKFTSLLTREVKIAGWVNIRRDHGKLIFLDLRDKDGIIQIVVNPRVSEEAHKATQDVRSEYVLQIIGKVNKRPEGAINKEIISGTVEIEATSVKIISKPKLRLLI